MSKGQTLRALVNERLAAAAEDIFLLFERTIAEYEEELCRYKENPRIELVRGNVQIPATSPGPGLKQEIPWTLQIKEEPEEQSIKQEEEQETQGEDISSEPHFHSETEGDTENSSDTDNDDDLEPHFSCTAAQMETEADGDHYNQDQIRDRDNDCKPPLTVVKECLSPKKKPSKRRHAEMTSGEIDQLEKDRSKANTVKQTKWAVKCFEDWCQDKGVEVDFQAVSKQQLNDILREFYGTVRNCKGELYGLSSYIGLRAGLNRHINDPPLSLSWCLLKNTEFTTSNNVFTGVVEMLRKKGLDATVHHTSITDADLNAIKRVLNPNNPVGLVNKVWFDIQLHFGRRGNEGNRQLKPSSFIIKTDENGLKYATLTFNENTENHNDAEGRNGESTRGFMYELPGDPLCPVSSLAKYLSLLPPDAPAFYLHPRRNVNSDLDKVWFTREPMGVNHLATMLPRLCKQAGTQQKYTNHCIRSTTRQIMTVGGHKSETSLQSYGRPNQEDHRKWSNIRATQTNTPAPPESRGGIGPPDAAQFFSECTTHRNNEINVNKSEKLQT